VRESAQRTAPCALARVAAAAGLIALALPAAVHAQGIGGTLGGFNVQRRVYYGAVVYEQTGLMYGAAGSVGLGPVLVEAGTLMGTLKGDGSPANRDADVRATAVRIQLAIGPWTRLGAQVEARRFEADAGVTVWRMIGAAAHVEPGLGMAGLRGFADVSVLPSSSVTDGPKLKVALQVAAGASYSPPRSPLSLRLGYRFERYDIEASGLTGERFEQFRGIVVEAGIGLGRQTGRSER